MANTPPILTYATVSRRRRLHALLWLFIADFALGLGWLLAALHEFFYSSRETPHIVLETFRLLFLGLTLFAGVACLAWAVVTWFRRMRGAE